MKIGIVSPEFPPEKGGIQTYAFEFTQELARREHGMDNADLAIAELSQELRQREQARGFMGVALYASATVLAFVFVPASLALMGAIPFLFVVPNLLSRQR